MNHVGKDLECQGFAFLAVNSQLKKSPQFVCIGTDKQCYFVIVKAVMLPKDPNTYDLSWMASFKRHAVAKGAKVLYAGVGLGNLNHKKHSIYLNEDYLLEYKGIQVIETTEIGHS